MLIDTPTQQFAPTTERLGYTVAELARACGLDPDTVRSNCKNGKIPSVRIGWQYIIPAAAVRRLFPEAKL